MPISDPGKRRARQRAIMRRRRKDATYRFAEDVQRDDPGGDNDKAAQWLREAKSKDPARYRKVADSAKVRSRRQLHRIQGFEGFPEAPPSSDGGDPEDDAGEYADNVFATGAPMGEFSPEELALAFQGSENYQPEKLTPEQKAKMDPGQRAARKQILAWERIVRGSPEHERPLEPDEEDEFSQRERRLNSTALTILERKLSFPFRMERDSQRPFRSRRLGDTPPGHGPSGLFADCQLEGLRSDPSYSLQRPPVRRVHASTHWGDSDVGRSRVIAPARPHDVSARSFFVPGHLQLQNSEGDMR